MADSALSRCVGDKEFFLGQDWGVRPRLTRANDPGAWSDVLTIDRIDDILTCRALTYPAFGMFKDGSEIPVGEFTITRARRHAVSDSARFLDLPRFLQLFDAGASFTLWQVDMYERPVLAFCDQLGRDLGRRFGASLFVTPPASRCFGVHHDDHDEFFLQVHGRKQWRLYRPQPGHRRTYRREEAGEPLSVIELRPGDCLYVPAGTPHAAVSLDDVSAHVTLDVIGSSWRDALAEAANAALKDPAFAEATTARGGSSDGISAELTARLDAFSRELRRVDSAALRTLGTGARETCAPYYRGRFADLAADGGPQPDSILTLVPEIPVELPPDSEPDGQPLVAGQRVKVDSRLLAALRLISRRGSVTVRGLDPNGDPEIAVRMARRLIAAGVVMNAERNGLPS
jgi:lysine-specific demethylase/histidyl-hydroxylase NO66